MAAMRQNRASRSDGEDADGGSDGSRGSGRRHGANGTHGASGIHGAGSERDDIPVGVRVRRQSATGPADRPGTIHVVVCRGADAEELEGANAVERLPKLIADPKASVWVDLVAPTARQADDVGKALGLHPLIVEDVLEGDRRAKIETS